MTNKKGGTTVSKSPSSSAIKNILQPMIGLMGVQFNFIVKREGFYPTGGGIIEC